MLSMFAGLWSYIYWYVRPVLKWFLRKTTQLCELQRICYGEEFGFNRSNSIEWSLNMSRSFEIQNMVDQLTNLSTQGRFIGKTCLNSIDYACRLTIDVKKINTKFHLPFIKNYRTSLFQIYGCRQLLYELEVLRTTKYSSDDPAHEEKLLKLWDLLKPDEPLKSRISKQWGSIGFQGDDPKTDFRGMGLLGLENLLYFATVYPDAARHVLSHSKHPRYGYSFAIVGINLTSMAFQLLKDKHLIVHFYNAVPGKPHLNDFHHVYCYLFYEFDKYWLAEKPRDIMEFGRIRAKFEEHIMKKLQDPKAILKLQFLVQTL